jgi:hypothetical protein
MFWLRDIYKSTIHIAAILTHVTECRANFHSNNSHPLQSGTCPMLKHGDVNPYEIPHINNVYKLHRDLKNTLILSNDH